MSEENQQPEAFEPRYFTGSANDYIEIAKRGKETLGLSLMYALHPQTGVGVVVTRFVVYCPTTHNLGEFKHFTPREEGKFKTMEGAEFIGMRLNRNIIPMFSPGPMPLKMLDLSDKFMFWDLLFDWTKDRVKSDDFEMIPEITKEHLRDLLGGKIGGDEQYKMLIEFPTFEKEAVKPNEAGD
jgi:hypothetical protein